ncbi:MAG TPA: cellulase family glycosylhydrolase [Candidatus Dormibacteraeota bacterium]|nr:cellulase family glycosylhydrolase [Candidatus Dormibacteraeota bacterium]
MIARAIAAVVVVLVAAATYPGAVAVSMVIRFTATATASPPGPPGALPWLHVEHPANDRPYIADDQKRMVLFHGAVPADLLDFGNSARPDAPPVYPIDPAAYEGGRCPAIVANAYPPLCQSDVAQMAAFGFNSLRLPLSWSLLEPERGRFNPTYVDRAAQVVDWARALGIYVIIDMHQNAYSRYVGPGQGVDLSANSGAPAWATLTDGLTSGLFLKSQREANGAVFEAFTNFWYNRGAIQDEYISAVSFLATRFKDDSAVAGYSIFNEPQPGWNLPPGFEDLLLFPFYRRVIDAVTGAHDGLPCPTGIFMPAFCGYADFDIHDVRHLFFLEPGLLRQITDFPTHLGLPVSSYPNLVFDIHAYTHGFTLEALLGNHDPSQATYPWGGYDQTYNLGGREATAMGAALFVSEFGDDPKYDSVLLANEVLEQEKYDVGFAFWTWKENSGIGWGMFDPTREDASPMQSSGCLRVARERLLARVYPRAASDPHVSYHYNADNGSFTLSAHARAGEPPTVVSIPPEVRGSVAVSGAATPVTDTSPDGNRLITVTPSGGSFSIKVEAAPPVFVGCG